MNEISKNTDKNNNVNTGNNNKRPAIQAFDTIKMK